MDWTDKRVVITGINGLMGAWLAKKLSQKGTQIVGADVSPKGMLAAHKLDIPVKVGDIRDYSFMMDCVNNADIVFHLAAISGVEHSRQLGMEAIDIIVRGTYTVLEAARMSKAKPSVIVATSNHVYGPQPSYPVSEDAGLFQIDTYSAAKICADVLTRAYWHNYHLRTAAVRNTNCFGPYSPHYDHLIEGTIQAILKGEKPVIRSRGLTKKSYMHVEDTVEAYICIADLARYCPGEAWNISNEPITVMNVINLICELMGWKGGITVLGETNDQADEHMNCGKLNWYGWKSRWTLKDAILDTMEWIKSLQSP